MPEEEQIQFPNYTPPAPHGIPVATPKEYSPLAKMMKFMLKSRKTVNKAPKNKVVSRKRKTKFY